MSSASPPQAAQACYRHPKVQAPISCNLCQRPICTSCMISAPVGWQCPTCVKGAPPVRRMRDIQAGGGLAGDKPYASYALIGICVAVYLAQQVPGFTDRFTDITAEAAKGEVWRSVTSGFLHANILHLALNIWGLVVLGGVVEGRVGRSRYLGIYAASLLGGSIGAMLEQETYVGALGASGAIYGLMGAMLVMPRRGWSPIESSIGGLIVINLLFTFAVPGISIGGHLGGLAVGLLGGLLVRVIGERGDVRRVALTTAILVALALAQLVAVQPIARWRCDTERSSPVRVPVGADPGFRVCP